MTLFDLEYLAKGMGLGATIALSFGPMKILCLRRVVAYGAAAGIVTAAGVVSGDAIYVAIAALGLTAVAGALHAAAPALRIAGGLMLLTMAFDAWRRRMPKAEPKLERSRYLPMYAGTVGLTLTNPTTIIMFATVLLSSGGLDAMDGTGGRLVAPGMVLGSAVVWTGFAALVIMAGRRLDPARLVWLNRAAAALFAYFGLSALAAGVRLLT